MAIDFNAPSQVRPYANLGAFPATGAVKTIYIAEDTNYIYRWNGTAYIEISVADLVGYVPYVGATQDLELGANELYTGKLWLYDSVNDNYGSVHFTDTDFHIEDADGHKMLVIEDGFMQIHKTDTIQSNLFTSGLTATRNHYLPDASGTIALTSDLAGYVPTSRTLTINGTTQDLSADRTFTISTGITIGTTPITSGTDGRVLFQNGGVVSQSAGITWDNTNKIFKVATGTEGIIIEGDAGGYPTLKINTLRSGATRRNWMFATEQINAGDFVLYRSTTGGGVANTLVYSIFNDGNIGVNTSANAGYKVDIAGTFRTTVSTETTPFVIAHTNGNFATILIGAGSQLAAGQMGMYFNGTRMWGWNGSVFQLPGAVLGTGVNATTLQIFGGWGGATLGTSLRLGSNSSNQGVYTATTGTQSTVEIGNSGNETWSPSSGNATYNLFNLLPRFNTTGTYSGIARGLYYNPTLTSITGLVHRAIETVTGDVLFATTSGSLLVGTTTNAGFKADINGTMRVTGKTSLNGQLDTNQTGSGHAFVKVNDNGTVIRISNWNIGNPSGNVFVGGSEVASALFALNSTTLGFLPPRMTTTQKNAIASPVAGLQVYDTTLNLMSYYNGTMWI